MNCRARNRPEKVGACKKRTPGQKPFKGGATKRWRMGERQVHGCSLPGWSLQVLNGA